MAHQLNILEELSKASEINPQKYSVDIKFYRNFVQEIIGESLKNNTANFCRLGNPIDNASVITNDLFPYIMYATDKTLTAFFGAKQNFFKFSHKKSFSGSKKPRKTLDVALNAEHQPNFSILALFIKDTLDQSFLNRKSDIAVIQASLNLEVDRVL